MSDITIVRHVRTAKYSMYGRVYYYHGNIFQPFGIHGSDAARVRIGIRNFMRDNKDMILADRKHPEYKTLVELYDSQAQNTRAGGGV